MHELLPVPQLSPSTLISEAWLQTGFGLVSLSDVSSHYAKGRTRCTIPFSLETLHAALLINGAVLHLHGGAAASITALVWVPPP